MPTISQVIILTYGYNLLNYSLFNCREVKRLRSTGTRAGWFKGVMISQVLIWQLDYDALKTTQNRLQLTRTNNCNVNHAVRGLNSQRLKIDINKRIASVRTRDKWNKLLEPGEDQTGSQCSYKSVDLQTRMGCVFWALDNLSLQFLCNSCSPSLS